MIIVNNRVFMLRMVRKANRGFAGRDLRPATCDRLQETCGFLLAQREGYAGIVPSTTLATQTRRGTMWFPSCTEGGIRCHCSLYNLGHSEPPLNLGSICEICSALSPNIYFLVFYFCPIGEAFGLFAACLFLCEAFGLRVKAKTNKLRDAFSC
jgi:hypothetical protein